MKRDQKAAVIPRVESALRSIGECVRRVRLSRRLSIGAAALRAGTSPRTVIRIEKGDPSVAMGAYAAILDVFDLLPALKDYLEREADKATRMLAEEHIPRKVRQSSRYNF